MPPWKKQTLIGSLLLQQWQTQARVETIPLESEYPIQRATWGRLSTPDHRYESKVNLAQPYTPRSTICIQESGYSYQTIIGLQLLADLLKSHGLPRGCLAQPLRI